MLPSDHGKRKAFPLLTFLTAYFPDFIEALVELSIQGNVQHNVSPDAVNPFKLPGDRITWDRSKSIDQCETIMRHVWDHMRALRGVGSVLDSDGILHITKAGWRCGAEGQLTIERLRSELAEANAKLAALSRPTPIDVEPDINGCRTCDPVPELTVAEAEAIAERAHTRGPRRPDGTLYARRPADEQPGEREFDSSD